MEPAQLYLDLLKRCLLDLIHMDDPLAGMAPADVVHRPPLGRAALRLANGAVRKLGLVLAAPPRAEHAQHAQLPALRDEGRDWPPRAHTMVGRKRLDHLQTAVETVLREGVPGDLIETGVWRGGSVILMRGVLAAYGDPERQVWVADSFRGLPPPDGKWQIDTRSKLHQIDFLAVSRSQVERNFQAYGLLDERVRFLEGWFENTLPMAPIERLAVLRLDGDMYRSTISVLDALYDRVSPGGFIIVDDYALPPCKAAITDFRAAHGITTPIEAVDWSGVFWRKQAA
jgi:O-methyltransferase